MKALEHLVWRNCSKDWQRPSFCWLKSQRLEKMNSILKSQYHLPLSSSWSGGWQLQAYLYHWNRTGSLNNWYIILLLLFLLPDNNPFSLHSFVPLRSLIAETCSRASIEARLRSLNGSGQKWLLLCHESHTWFSLWDSPKPICLQYWGREKS